VADLILWARDYHATRFRQGAVGAAEMQMITERWLAECCEAADRIMLPDGAYLQRSGLGRLLEVAAIRFLDEAGEILVTEVDGVTGQPILVGEGDDERLVQHWVRAPVRIPQELMKLVVGKNLDRGSPHVGRTSV
jgi:hypothetical protein